MFEKEAKEAFKKRYPNNIAINSYYVEGFKDGAEFGYNKGKEEQKHNTHTVAHLSDCISEAQKNRIKELENDVEVLKGKLNDYAILLAERNHTIETKDTEIRLLGERCKQLIKDKGDLGDKNKKKLE